MRGLNAAAGTHPSGDAAREHESARQQQLLDALLGSGCARPHDLLPGWQRGVAAYRANAAAHAAEVLRAQYPTALAMLGAEAFDSLSAAHWQACPPTRGDLARFGGQFPLWLEQRQDLAPWPWLHDCTRLDQALWQVQFAPPSRLCDADLRRLADSDPDSLVLRLAPATQMVASSWAIVRLRELHAASEADLDAIAHALHSGAQTAWVWRQGFERHCIALDAAATRWMRALREGPTLGAALTRTGDDFDVGAWLAQAVRAGWIDGVDAVTKQETTP